MANVLTLHDHNCKIDGANYSQEQEFSNSFKRLFWYYLKDPFHATVWDHYDVFYAMKALHFKK